MPEEHALYASLGAHDLPNVDPILVGFDEPESSRYTSGQGKFEELLKRIEQQKSTLAADKQSILEKVNLYKTTHDGTVNFFQILCYDGNGNKINTGAKDYAEISDLTAPYVTNRTLADNRQIRLIEMEAILTGGTQ